MDKFIYEFSFFLINIYGFFRSVKIVEKDIIKNEWEILLVIKWKLSKSLIKSMLKLWKWRGICVYWCLFT